MTLPNMASAGRRFSFAFPSSTCLSRVASGRPIPPCLAFGPQTVAGLNPSFRQGSEAGNPFCATIDPQDQSLNA